MRDVRAICLLPKTIAIICTKRMLIYCVNWVWIIYIKKDDTFELFARLFYYTHFSTNVLQAYLWLIYNDN